MMEIARRCFTMLDPGLRGSWALALVMALAAAVLELAGTGAVFGLIAVIAEPAQAARLPVVGRLVAGYLSADPIHAPLVLGGGVAVFFAFKNGFLFFQSYALSRASMDSCVIGAGHLLRGYLRAPYHLHFQRNPAELIRNLTRTVDDVFGAVVRSAVGLVSESLVLLALVGVLVISQPLATISAVAVLGSAMMAVAALSKRVFVTRGRRVQALASEIIQAANEAIGAAKEIRVLGCEDFFWRRFHDRRVESGAIQRLTVALLDAPRLVMETALVMGMVAVVAVFSALGDGKAIIPVIGLFGYVGFRALPSVNRMLIHVGNIRQGTAAVETLWRDHQALCLDDKVPLSEPVLRFQRDLVLKGVGYTYHGGRGPVLSDVDLVVPRHAIIGVVGSTGAGKSTLIDIILGLLQPSSGQVLVDGIDVAGHLRAWQRGIGYVPQTIYLTDDTLRRNIAFGCRDAEIDEARLKESIGLAQLEDFIGGLPGGLETMVGDRGVLLSGGQRQRVGIARALYHQPELLIFDEATSALDAETEREVTRAIDGLAGRKTMILIAHRLSTLEHCDRLVFLKDGRIAGVGSAGELAEANEDFRRIAGAPSLPTGVTS